ncbi:hypothetical protein [Brazilian marseillevirus]|uniref:hypothetical protein n=1 Tax=Brazilian marseillevirus TaxID=1813599 RepID=UPI000782B51F|nr:hypothetical protein A3303_gp044 [Brazilian marseillevirus]AMQ10552.1 hypothetical protein [Brazilian marseillevirus]
MGLAISRLFANFVDDEEENFDVESAKEEGSEETSNFVENILMEKYFIELSGELLAFIFM